MKIILQNKCIKNESQIELGDDVVVPGRVEKKCYASSNTYALSKNVPYNLYSGLPRKTHYTSVYKSSYSKFVLDADSNKSSITQDKKMISHQFCSFRKYWYKYANE
jgi:hypothetical protein